MQKHEDLKAARRLSGKSQAEAATIIGVSRVTYNSWENGKTPIPAAKFYAFLEAIGTTQADLDAHFASLPATEQPPGRVVTEAAVEEFIHALPRARAESLCASMLHRHPQPAPKKLEYDRRGYPLGVWPFDLNTHDAESFAKRNPGVDVADALVRIEGASYLDKERMRAVLRAKRQYPNDKDEDHLQRRDKYMREWDAANSYFSTPAVDTTTAYDADGYPEGFSRKARSAASAEDKDEAYTAALVKAEGADFVAREVERARIALAAIYGANKAMFEAAWSAPEGVACSKATALRDAQIDYNGSLC